MTGLVPLLGIDVWEHASSHHLTSVWRITFENFFSVFFFEAF